jgi:hypothetical protein
MNLAVSDLIVRFTRSVSGDIEGRESWVHD